MDFETDEKIIEVIPYSNSGIQVIIGCLLLIPGSLFIIYAPFRNPCSPDRTSGDCSLGSPFMEQIYTFGMVALGFCCIAFCAFLIRRYHLGRNFRKGHRIAFTQNSIIGPIWGFWSSPEGEIKFSEIIELSIVETKNASMIRIVSTSKKMIIQPGFLRERCLFKRLYNYLARELGKPTFEETASPELIKAMLPLKVQMEEYKHLIAAFIYFSIGGILTLAFGSHAESQSNDDIYAIGFLISLAGFIYIVTAFHKQVWISSTQSIILFCFLMLFGMFLGFIGTIGILSL